MEKKELVAITIFVVVLIAFVGIVFYEQGKESEEGGGTAWTSRHKTVKQISFELGAKEDKDVSFYLPMSPSWRNEGFSVNVQSSGDIDLSLLAYVEGDEEWNEMDTWEGVSSLNQSFSYHFPYQYSGDMILEVSNGSINIFESKNVSVEISAFWEEKK